MRNKIIVNGNEVMVTKAFERKAKIYGTEEYKLWKQVCSEISEAYMVTKTIKKNPKKKTFKNLTYKNIERFLMAEENSESLFKDYMNIKEQSAIQTSPYRAVIAWFIKKYPNYDSYKKFFSDNTEENNQEETTDAVSNNNVIEPKTTSM